ncbi:M56 family metallopeptidase [Mucilaginibacter arboris]|uniref:M48 family metalloprotease n=1 Tax=Mucilaginibacter arboris TaxID=2682090 RepID=A0A7K1SSU7_9SPHI|nr:M56 family metallopeptidase [Mucilaginibacter arboris]MVN20365.1 M48 family metalloprotease [Mucilaginibacter arboris]
METSLFISALSKTLPESFLQGVVIYLALRVAFAVFKNTASSAQRFNLYYAANVLLFAGFLFTLFNHYQEAQASALTSSNLPGFITKDSAVVISKPAIWTEISYWTSRYAYTITGLYLTGLIFCALRLAIGIVNINWVKNNGNSQQNNYWSEQVNKLSKHFNLVKTVSLFLSDKIQVPLTIGFFKPVIVFPIALINQLSVEQTEAILLHELAHIKRADYLLNILLNIIQSFLFFNPAVWLMNREIDKYREQCCDDLVIENSADKLIYAQALLAIEEYRSTQLNLALAANGKKYTLLNRIKRITNMKTTSPSPQNKFVVMLLAFTVIGLSVAWNAPAKKALKRLVDQHFKVIKEASDSIKAEQFISKTVYYPVSKSPRKNKLTEKQHPVNFFADTAIRSKNKFKIVLEDSLGNKKEYNSVAELPADAQKEFLKENGKFDNKFTNVTFTYKHPDSTKYSYHSKFYDLQDLKRQADEIKKMEEMRENSPEFKKQMEELRTKRKDLLEKAWLQLNSQKFKKQTEELRVKRKDLLEEMNKQFAEITKYYNSPEWKKYEKEMLKYYQSPEWKKYEKQMLKNYNGPDTVAVPKKEKLN